MLHMRLSKFCSHIRRDHGRTLDRIQDQQPGTQCFLHPLGQLFPPDRLLSPPERDPVAFVPAQFSLQVRSDQLRDLRSGHRESE